MLSTISIQWFRVNLQRAWVVGQMFSTAWQNGSAAHCNRLADLIYYWKVANQGIYVEIFLRTFGEMR